MQIQRRSGATAKEHTRTKDCATLQGRRRYSTARPSCTNSLELWTPSHGGTPLYWQRLPWPRASLSRSHSRHKKVSFLRATCGAVRQQHRVFENAWRRRLAAHGLKIWQSSSLHLQRPTAKLANEATSNDSHPPHTAHRAISISLNPGMGADATSTAKEVVEQLMPVGTAGSTMMVLLVASVSFFAGSSKAVQVRSAHLLAIARF